MIMDILKRLWKWIFWILIILLIGAIVLAFRIFVIDKDYNGTKRVADRNKKIEESYATDTVDGNGSSSSGAGSLGQKVVNGAKSIANSTVAGYKGDSEYDYNAHNFDEWFLMYEGEQYDGAVKNILDHLITNADGNFYARTSVTAVGFGNDATVNYNGDVSAYQNSIREMENAVTGGMYDVSFRYAGVMTYVNEIVITKK